MCAILSNVKLLSQTDIFSKDDTYCRVKVVRGEVDCALDHKEKLSFVLTSGLLTLTTTSKWIFPGVGDYLTYIDTNVGLNKNSESTLGHKFDTY